MKLSSLSLSALSFGTQWSLATATSFENTAPIFVSSNIANGIESKYIDTVENVNGLLKDISEEFCAKKDDSQLIYLRLHGVDDFQLSSIDFSNTNDITLKTLTNLVVYPNNEIVPTPELGESCMVAAYYNSPDDLSLDWSTYAQVALIDIYNSDKIKEIIETIRKKNILYELIVQVVPTFEAPSNSLLQQTSEKIKDIIDSTKKRDGINYDEVEQKLKDSFEEIYELVDESPVSAWEEKSSFIRNDKSTIVNPNGSLFDNYAFFSTGIWMTTIVFLFLVWLLSIALGWLSDLKISYRAFDKAIDFEKKLQ